MGNKTRPTSLRIGITKDWDSRWFPKKAKFGTMLEEDHMIRTIIDKKIHHAGIASIIIEKAAAKIRITIRTARPGLIIGRGGKGVEELTQLLESTINAFRIAHGIKEKITLNLTIEEIKRYEASAPIIAQSIAADLERRFPYRRTIKKHLERVMQSRDVQGAKIRVSGRLNGAEIARVESLSNGKLPLHTLRANLDYGDATAYTTYGTIGVKVWIYKGEVFEK
jgi:small subunit ribosomal protein S3